MLLAVDIGNTNVDVGLFDGERLRDEWDIATDVYRTSDEYGMLILGFLRESALDASEVRQAVLCSVNPTLVPVFKALCRRYFKVSPLVVEAGVKTGVSILLDKPHEVGPDRIVNAVAAHHLYGGPLIVIDLGTATTFDVVSEKGEYLGGAISPGIRIATDALFQRTARLPRLELARPKQAIGKDTVSAMQSGILFGYVGLIEGLVQRIQNELDPKKARVIATGGYAELLAKETKVIEIVNPFLTLTGLRVIYERNFGKAYV